jgi:hypothetical protein
MKNKKKGKIKYPNGISMRRNGKADRDDEICLHCPEPAATVSELWLACG